MKLTSRGRIEDNVDLRELVSYHNHGMEGNALYAISFYVRENGDCPVLDYLNSLEGRTDKDSRIKRAKIEQYMYILRRLGTTAGEPFVKHIESDIWELRPLRDRIFFVGWNGERFVMLHCFVKKSQKTPKREIERAKQEYEDLKQRGNVR